MMRSAIILLIFCCSIEMANAQNNTTEEKRPAGRSNAVSAGMDLAIGGITGTHGLGFGLEFYRSKNLFGRLTSLPASSLGFIYGLTVDYLLGKKDSYDVKYKSYGFIQACGGFVLNAGLNANIGLTAGPSASIYANSTLLGIGIRINGNFYLANRIGLSPSLLLLKQSGINTIWITSIKGSFAF